MFTETAVAVAGTLQVLTITNVRLVPPESGGPPSGPTGLRVSMMRQGKTVKKLVAPGRFVGVGVGVPVNVGVTVGVFVEVLVGLGVVVGVGVAVGVFVSVLVGVVRGVFVGVRVGVFVAVPDMLVRVSVGV